MGNGKGYFLEIIVQQGTNMRGDKCLTKQKCIDTDGWLPGQRGVKMGGGSQKAQTCSYEISPGDVMDGLVNVVHNTVSYI